ncbi:Liprin-beta-1 [Chionoecetes opilio]|uniref:Liprin-beta-1 n=1 Tax=Chionoecetes opilio TaxID=41210 RepID=A0A8J4XU07_CHIOP|nr:Liprin-beta-1 [Chionoecetes opilio]
MPVFKAVVSKQKAMILSLHLLQDHCSHVSASRIQACRDPKKELGIIFPCEEDGDAVLRIAREGREEFSVPMQDQTSVSLAMFAVFTFPEQLESSSALDRFSTFFAVTRPSSSFDRWSMETLETWLGAQGLTQYCSALRSWTLSGHHISKATPQNLERDLGIRHPLHKKKLQLAISARLTGDQTNTPLHRLDHSWVLRWLDDVGLPQYKDAFSEARIDGRVLNCLTYDDLSFLRLSNLLHVTSLKRGIQVLREHNFDPSALKRRSVPDEDPRARTSIQVSLWTNHRVMEWLRTVDLSEYAPNLRGSGVHGALMVYDVRFTSEVLASLLSIPSGKTLLRRHLNTHFKELVGRCVVQEKRELAATSGYMPLTTSAKVKMPKKSQFSLKRKKSKSELDFDDLLCPLDEKPPIGALQDREKELVVQRLSAPPVVGRITKV